MRFLLIFLFATSNCNCWIINNISSSAIDSELKEENDNVALQRFNLLYPGTKWCGAGNVADGYNDLGHETEVDACCRDHDYCPDIIPGGETLHNLTNTAFYTRLSCECDEKFRQCLRHAAAKGSTAQYVGIIYFNALGTQCFREDFPIIRCLKKSGRFQTKCVEYEYNTKAEKKYQWFDVPDFRS